MPAPVQDLDGLDQRPWTVVERPAHLLHLGHRRVVGNQDPATPQRGDQVPHHPPRLGDVEHRPVIASTLGAPRCGRCRACSETGRIHCVIRIAQLDVVATERLVPCRSRHVRLRPLGKVLPQLVAGDHRAAAQQSR